MVMFDVNLSVGRWPFTPLPQEDMETLVPHLAKYGITGGLVRSNEAALSAHLDYENEMLFKRCAGWKGFIPLPVVNPDYAYWRTCQSKAVLLYPSFHNYSLSSGAALDMARAMAAKKHVFVISMREEDERAQHPLCKMAAPSLAELKEFAAAVPESPVIVLNNGVCGGKDWEAPNLYYDIAFAEPFNMAAALQTARRGHVLFGSHAPFFAASAAVSKLSDGLDAALAEEIASKNAAAIL